MKSAQDGACLIAGHSIGPKVVLLNIATAEMLEPIVIMRWELPALKVDTERHPPPRVRKGSLSSRVACYAFFCSAAASFLVGLASTGPIGSFRCFSAIWARDIRVELVGQAADDDDKYTRKQGGDADRDVALAVGEVQVIARGRRDVQGCLGKEPEGNDRQDNSQDQPVVTFVGWGRGEAQVRVGHLGILRL